MIFDNLPNLKPGQPHSLADSVYRNAKAVGVENVGYIGVRHFAAFRASLEARRRSLFAAFQAVDLATMQGLQ